MDKTKLIKLISKASITVSTISSTASKLEKDRILRDFNSNINRIQDGEIVLVLVKA